MTEEIVTVASGKNRSAIRWAERAHRGQHRRSDPDVPYITHCIAVAEVAASIGASRNVVTACILHDIVEDTDITLDQIFVEFGAEVAGIVDAVTKKEKVRLEDQAKWVHRSLVESKYPREALVVKGCDLLINMSDLVWDCEERGAGFLKEIFDRPDKPRYERKVRHYIDLAGKIAGGLAISNTWGDDSYRKLHNALLHRSKELEECLDQALAEDNQG